MKKGFPDFPFVGRSGEMQKLHQIWEEVRTTGCGPRMVTILGEPGYGKTRLIREFYKTLTNEAESSYWPKDLPEGDQRADINPLFSDDHAQSPIPWLWWGIRCSSAEDRNAAQDEGCALIRSSEHLIQHTGALEKKRAEAEKRARIVNASITQLLKFAEEVPLLGTVIRFYSSGKDWLEFFQSAVDATKKTQSLTPGQKTGMDIQKACDGCVEVCKAFIDPSDRNLPTVPLVLVVDDAQHCDSLTIQCIYRIFHFAYTRNLPLLMLATYWAKDWKSKDSETPGNLTTTESWKSFRQIESALPLRLDTERCAIFHQIECDSMDCAPILQKLNLGLGEKEERHCLDFADGNPQLLRELLAFLFECRAHHSKNWWFKNDAPSLELSDRGFEEFRASSHSKDEFLKKRAEEIQQDPHLATLLQLGAMQGHNFLGCFTAEIWNSLGDTEHSPRPDHLDLLRSGEDPHHVIRLSEMDNRFARFRHRSYWEAFLSVDPSKRQTFLDAISAKTADWLETLPADVGNADFFQFAVNWFREVSENPATQSSKGNFKKALKIRADQLLKLGQPTAAAELFRERLELLATENGKGSPDVQLAEMDYAKALAEAGNFSESLPILGRLRESFSTHFELWVDCSRSLAHTLQQKSEADGVPKASFATAVAGVQTGTPERDQAARILMEVWVKLHERFEPESLDMLLAGLEFGNAFTEGARDNLLGADQRLLVDPCAALLLEKYGDNEIIKDAALSVLGAYLKWGWKIEPPKNSRFPAAESFYEAHIDSVRGLQKRFPKARDVYQELCAHRTRVLGETHPATLEAHRLEVLCQPGTEKLEALVEQFTSILGEDHLETLKCECALAEWLSAHCDKQFEAAKLFKRVLEKSSKSLGVQHPLTTTLQNKIQKILPNS